MAYYHDAPLVPTYRQCRAARSALGWTLDQAADVTEVSRGTILKYEAGGDVRLTIVEKLREGFELYGVRFAPDGLGLTWHQPDAS